MFPSVPMRTPDIAMLALLTTWTVATIALVFVANRKNLIVLSSKQFPSPPGASDLAARFEERRRLYSGGVDALHNNMKFQLAIVILGVLIALGPEVQGTTIPGTTITIPLSVLYWVVVIGAIYLWTKFGFLLNQLIENRAALLVILRELGDNLDGGPFSRVPLLRDYGPVDAYFLGIGSTQGIDDTVPSLSRVYLIIFGLLGSATHAAAFSSIWIAASRATSPTAWRVFLVTYVVALFIFGGTHFQFAASGHRNWISYVIVVAAFILTIALWLISN